MVAAARESDPGEQRVREGEARASVRRRAQAQGRARRREECAAFVERLSPRHGEIVRRSELATPRSERSMTRDTKPSAAPEIADMAETLRALKPGGERTIPKLHLPIQRFPLECGSLLLFSHRPSAPVFAMQAHIRGGPSLDPVGREGTAFLAGTLVDQGTEKYSEEDIANLLEPAGGEVAGDAGGLGGAIVNEEWPLLVEIMSELLKHPTYPTDKVSRQKKRLLDRLHVEMDDPRAQGGMLFRKLVYGDHWLGRAAYGTIESVARIGPRDLARHHAEHRVARRAVIAVCGDVDPQALQRELDRKLRGWKSGTPLSTRPPNLPKRARRFGAFPAKRQQVHIYLGHLGITRNDPDYAALVVMDHILGTGPGFTNRISRVLRDELGLAYSVNASIHSTAGILPGMFTAYIGTSPKHVATAVRGFLSEIRRIQSDRVSDDELELSKSYLIGSFPLGFERASRRASYLVSSELHAFPPDNLERMLEAFAAVTAEDVQRVAQKHLFPDASCLVAAGPISRSELVKIVDEK
jgi:zinc protease